MDKPSSTLCPSCKAPLPDTGQFAVWCPACDWNVEAEDSLIEWRETALDKLISRMRARYAERQYQDLVGRDPHSLRPRWTLGKLASYVLAAVVNLLPFVLAAFAAWMIYANWLSLGATLWGTILLLAAWALLPARSRMPKNLLPRENAPMLYDLVDRVAAANGAANVHALVIDPEWNASFQQAGLLRRSVVTLGLPLWSILAPQERVALLSHEFAHGSNRDSLTQGFVGRAIVTLMRLSYTFQPSYDDFFAMILSPVLAVVSGLFRWLAVLMIYLYWQRSQEAEFRADYSAARVAGSDAVQSLMRKTPLAIYLRPVLDPISYSLDWRGQSFVPALRAFIANLPPLERERLARAEALKKFDTHTTHPPRWARLGFLDRHSSPPSLIADAAEMERIDRELERLEPIVTSQLLGRYYPAH